MIPFHPIRHPSTPRAAVAAVAAAAIAAGARVDAQEPARAPLLEQPPVLMPVDALIGRLVYQSMPMQDGGKDDGKDEGSQPAQQPEGSTAHRPVARLRDIVFAEDGAAGSYVIELSSTGERRRLPAANAEWQQDDGRLVTPLSDAALAGLPRWKPEKQGEGAEPDAEPDAAPDDAPGRGRAQDAAARPGEGADQGLLATKLRDAELRVGDREVEGLAAKASALWLDPQRERLVFTSIEIGDRVRLVPWEIVQTARDGERLLLDLSTIADRLAAAPAVDNPKIPPTESQQTAAREHFATGR